MSRIVSVWLPRWPILRALAAQAKRPTDKPIAPDRPFVLAVAGAGGPRIAALNEAAEACGLSLGETVADARAKAGFLQVRGVDTAADETALRRLALWATRYTPTASPYDEDNGADGFFLDIEGAAHLFGGERSLIADLAARLESFGLPARLAVADTPGAAWAASRFHPDPGCILSLGAPAETLSPLPIEALRLAPEICATLRRLGFKSIGALTDQPRAPFAARFPAQFLRRLDQALGRLDEPLVPVVPPPVYHTFRYLLEPIVTQEAVVALANRLMATLAHVLTRDDVGARALKLSLYRVDGDVKTLDIALTLPTRSAAHVARMVALKLDAAAATDDAGFGFEAIGLAVIRAEPMPARQLDFPSLRGAAGRVAANNVSGGVGGALLENPPPLPPPHHSLRSRGEGKWPMQDDEEIERCAALVDTLRQRLGPHRVRHFAAVASHLPERAEALNEIDGEPFQFPPLSGEGEGLEPEQLRPLLLLPHAEPTEVTALVPDGPPRRFCWRGVTYDVAGAQGPERIGAEWWRAPNLSAHCRASGNPVLGPRFREDERNQQYALTRDYYLVEDLGGHRFWLFREGLYGRETIAARWFVHGLFA